MIMIIIIIVFIALLENYSAREEYISTVWLEIFDFVPNCRSRRLCSLLNVTFDICLSCIILDETDVRASPVYFTHGRIFPFSSVLVGAGERGRSRGRTVVYLFLGAG